MKKLLLKYLHPKYLIYLISYKNLFFGETELSFLKKFVDPQRDAIDIGAHRGIYSFFLTKLAKKVYIHEPNPTLYNFLKKISFKNAQLSNLALSDNENVAELRIPILNDNLTSSWGTISEKKQLFDNYKSFIVNTTSLDILNYQNIGFVKIDVEGHEYKLIEGAINFLKTNKPVLLIEIEQRHNDINIDKIFNIIVNLGYSGYFILNNKLLPLSKFSIIIHQNINKRIYINNFFFVPKNFNRNN